MYAEKPNLGSGARKLTEEMAEVLEALWTMEEQGISSFSEAAPPVARDVTPHILESLRREDLIELGSGGKATLLPEGRALAEGIIRRHRLAERLICDVLGSSVDESEDAACEFEHVLAEGIANSICTLLGHPRFCPHQRPIPEGDCCRQAREELKPIVVSSEQLMAGESARVAYLSSGEHGRLLRLSALGITPGATIRLLQRWPSFVFQCDQTEIALEQDVARHIYVWRTPQE
jgi:DtxR family transcriptional regulator, Mn-dependent transcriptional regulator